MKIGSWGRGKPVTLSLYEEQVYIWDINRSTVYLWCENFMVGVSLGGYILKGSFFKVATLNKRLRNTGLETKAIKEIKRYKALSGLFSWRDVQNKR